MIEAIQIFPQELRGVIEAWAEQNTDRITEIRLRIHRPVCLCLEQRDQPLTPADGVVVDRELLDGVLRRATGAAAYAVQQQLIQGFLPLRGGHRLGICGRAVLENGAMEGLGQFSSVNLRIARQVPGCANLALSALWQSPHSTLVAGPPGSGKTTVLRDLIRQLSDRMGQRIGVVDERDELAACVEGVPQFDLGRRTDVLSQCRKAQGIYMLLRAMGPQWIAVDEISTPEDADTIIRASYSGVRLLATAHIWQREDLERRPLYRTLMEAGVFRNLILLEPGHRLRCERIGT